MARKEIALKLLLNQRVSLAEPVAPRRERMWQAASVSRGMASFVVTAKTLFVPRVVHALTVMAISTGSKLPVAPRRRMGRFAPYAYSLPFDVAIREALFEDLDPIVRETCAPERQLTKRRHPGEDIDRLIIDGGFRDIQDTEDL